MSSKDKRIDDYISKSADFAKPILVHLRALVHQACPGVVETWKWSFPNFDYAGKILCSMAAFKQHCTFGFFYGALMKDPEGIMQAVGEKTSMGHLGQIKSLRDLPSDKIMIRYLKEAMKLCEAGVTLPKAPKITSQTLEIPDYITAAINKNKKAKATFEKFSPSHKKEYVMWITGAKTEATREKRLEQALEWMTEGKHRNWKYDVK